MKVELLYRPAFTLGMITLDGNEEVRVEAASMVSMSRGITIETAATGGVLASLGRSLFGGESFFQNTFRAPAGGGQIGVAPALAGDLIVLDLQDETMLVQSGSFVAADMRITTDTKWKGAKTFFASEGLIMLRSGGTGPLVLSSYGAIHEMNLAAGETVTIDTGHLVAFSESLGFQVRQVGNLTSTLFSGEGLVVDLTGPGRLLAQTRSTDQFLSWLIPKLPRQAGSGS
jgi:uncharacterized protein (TIGR00266 family)